MDSTWAVLRLPPDTRYGTSGIQLANGVTKENQMRLLMCTSVIVLMSGCELVCPDSDGYGDMAECVALSVADADGDGVADSGYVTAHKAPNETTSTVQ